MAWFGGLRYIKSQYGDNIITLSAYWWGASFVSPSFFKRTPAASRRYWIFLGEHNHGPVYQTG
ncbi:type IV conjugative transfer system protein TraL [Vibrio sinaloensis]|nr:type IV conjugative transfer system protein TraL [Vibrio sinaloensis]